MKQNQREYWRALDQYKDGSFMIQRRKRRLDFRDAVKREVRSQEECQFGAWQADEKCQSENILNILRSNLNVYENNYSKLSQNFKNIGTTAQVKYSHDLASNGIKNQSLDKQNQIKLPLLKQNSIHRKGQSVMSSQSILFNKIQVQQKRKTLSKNSIMVDVYRNLKSKYSDLSGNKDGLQNLFLRKQKYQNISKTLKINLAKQQRTHSLKPHQNNNSKHLDRDDKISSKKIYFKF